MRKFSYFLFLLFSLSLSAQVNLEWVRRYDASPGLNSPSFDEGRSLAVDDSGNVFVTGYEMRDTSFWDYISNFLTVKYDSAGNFKWAVEYDGTNAGNDEARELAIDALGNVYVTGFSDGINSDRDILTIKYNTMGVQQWVARYNGPANMDDEGNSIALDSQGNIYVAGKSAQNTGSENFTILKYDNAGNLVWSRILNGNATDVASKIVLNKSDFIYATGTFFTTTGGQDIVTVKYDTSGNLTWIKYYDGGGNQQDIGKNLVADTLGNVFVCGTTTGQAAALLTTIKYDVNGNQVWATDYSGAYAIPHEIATDNNGKAFVCGNDTANFSDYLVIGFNSSGAQSWDHVQDSTLNDDFAYAITTDKYGDVYVTGQYHIGQENIVTIKYANNGARLWTMIYTLFGGDDRGFDIQTDDDRNVYVTGHSSGGIATSFDMVTIKYSQPFVKTMGTSEIIFHDDFSVFPNPSAGNFTVTSEIKGTFEIVNLIGETVYQGRILSSATEISKNNLPDGIYFLNIKNDRGCFSKKIIINSDN